MHGHRTVGSDDRNRRLTCSGGLISCASTTARGPSKVYQDGSDRHAASMDNRDIDSSAGGVEPCDLESAASASEYSIIQDRVSAYGASPQRTKYELCLERWISLV